MHLSTLFEAVELAPDDQYAAQLRIWIIRARLGERQRASEDLTQFMVSRRNELSDYRFTTAAFLVDAATENDLMDVAKPGPDLQKDPDERPGAQFYVGMRRLIDGNHAAAVAAFRKVLLGPAVTFEYTSATYSG